MTCKEMLMMNHPEMAGQVLGAGGVNACPGHYGYLLNPEWCDYNPRSCTGGARCAECWDREIPGTLPMQYLRDCETAKQELEAMKAEKDFDEAMNKMKKVVTESFTSTIKDSGDRTQFETGAVRDMREGKGRCDLMPLEVVAKWLKTKVLDCIAQFKIHGDTIYLYGAMNYFLDDAGWSYWEACLEVAKHFEEGAKKYGESNWKKGIPVHCYIDSALRHYFKFMCGMKDEPHDRAFVWNLMCCIWEADYGEECRKHKEAVNT